MIRVLSYNQTIYGMSIYESSDCLIIANYQSSVEDVMKKAVKDVGDHNLPIFVGETEYIFKINA